MKDMDEQTVERLVKEALEIMPAIDIYNQSIKNVDIEALQDAQSVSTEDIAATFAVAGFAEGIRFVLRNLTIKADEETAKAQS